MHSSAKLKFHSEVSFYALKNKWFVHLSIFLHWWRSGSQHSTFGGVAQILLFLATTTSSLGRSLRCSQARQEMSLQCTVGLSWVLFLPGCAWNTYRETMTADNQMSEPLQLGTWPLLCAPLGCLRTSLTSPASFSSYLWTWPKTVELLHMGQ